MKLEHLEEIAQILNKCGAPVMIGGARALAIPRVFIMPMVIDPGTSYTFQKEVTGPTPWVLRSICCDQASASLEGIRVQIQLPNGRFLFGGNGIDIGQFCWIGSWRWLQDPDLRAEPGQKINVTLTDSFGTLSASTTINLTFEGAYLFFLSGGPPAPLNQQVASTLPRYFGIVNENILAPPWMSGEGHITPDGYEDEYFIYSTPNPTDFPKKGTWILSAGAITQTPTPLPFEIPIDPGYEFFVRRPLVDLEVTGTAAACVLAKLRTGTGYILNDNFIDYARYLCGAETPGFWRVAGGDSVFIDVQLADFSGTGNVTYEVFLEGFRRRKL